MLQPSYNQSGIFANPDEALLNQSRTFLLGLFLEGVLGVGGSIANIVFLILLHKTPRLDRQLFFLLYFLSLNAVALTVCHTVRAAVGLGERQVSYSVPECVKRESAILIFLQSTHLSFTVISLERLYAKRCYRTYNNDRISPTLVLLTVIIWGASILCIVVFYFFPADYLLPFCAFDLLTWPAILIGAITCHSLAEIAEAMIFWYVLSTSRRQLEVFEQTNLSARVELRRLISSTEMLLPIALTHVVCHGIALGSLFPVILTPLNLIPLTTKVTVLQFTSYVSPSVLTFVFPILCIQRNKHMRHVLLSFCRRFHGRFGGHSYAVQNKSSTDTNLPSSLNLKNDQPLTSNSYIPVPQDPDGLNLLTHTWNKAYAQRYGTKQEEGDCI